MSDSHRGFLQVPFAWIRHSQLIHLRLPNRICYWSWQPESNRRPADYKAAALPTELCQQIGGSSGPRTQDLPVMSERLYAAELRIHKKATDRQTTFTALSARPVSRPGGFPPLYSVNPWLFSFIPKPQCGSMGHQRAYCSTSTGLLHLASLPFAPLSCAPSGGLAGLHTGPPL